MLCFDLTVEFCRRVKNPGDSHGMYSGNALMVCPVYIMLFLRKNVKPDDIKPDTYVNKKPISRTLTGLMGSNIFFPFVNKIPDRSLPPYQRRVCLIVNIFLIDKVLGNHCI